MVSSSSAEILPTLKAVWADHIGNGAPLVLILILGIILGLFGPAVILHRVLLMIDTLIGEWRAAKLHLFIALTKYQRTQENAQRLSKLGGGPERANLISGLDIAERRYDDARLAWQAADDRLQAHFQHSNIIERFYIIGALLSSTRLIAANDNGTEISAAPSRSD